MTRVLDILFSLIGLFVLSPLFVFISIWILFDSKGGLFFRQTRVGQNGVEFKLLKFRSMRPNSENLGQLTIGKRDPRVTNSGQFIRTYKLDELPQLINVLKGEMSIVGPRPEVPKYVSLYNQEQRKVLAVKPGITDIASLEYFHESELLANSIDPEKTYIEEVMPAKLVLNLRYIQNPSVSNYLSIIFKTLLKVIQ